MPDYNINLTIKSILSGTQIILDIAIVWFIIFYALKVVRSNSRTIQLFKGIILILIVNGVSNYLGLHTLAYFANMFVNWGFLAIIIIFQPEIRQLLERIGKSNAFNKAFSLNGSQIEDLIVDLCKVVSLLSKEQIGALITLEQSQSLEDYINTGVKIDARVSAELLTSIFVTSTPLHDGAVIIEGNTIACASAYYPPTNLDLPSKFGARHRAAIGISEITDSITIVVSEETGLISIADKGKISTVDIKQLKDYLVRVLRHEETEVDEKTSSRSIFIMEEAKLVIEEEDNLKASKLQLKKREQKHSNNSIFAGVFKNKKETEKDEDDLDMKMPHHKKANNFSKDDFKDEVAVTDVIEITQNTSEDKGGKDNE